MIEKDFFNILQYNVRKGRKTNMIPLLHEPAIKNYDVLAIQESWKNSRIMTSLSASRSGFYLAYKLDVNTRMCFYINQNIDPQEWKVEHPSPDMNTLKLRLWSESMAKMIHIHNVYNPSSASYASTDSPSTLSMVERQLQADVEHVLMGDFNLHHPLWCGPSRPTQHAAASQLLDLVEAADLDLTLPQGTVTWQARNATSTIDLVFMSRYLRERLIHCETKPEWNQSSDHIPISSSILMSSVQTEGRRSRAWKQIDVEKLHKLCENMPQPIDLQDITEIDAFALSLEKWLQWAVEETMPWKRTHDRSNPYWSDECGEAVKEARRLRRVFTDSQNERDWKAYLHANDCKQKVIRKAKTLEFRKAIDTNAANKGGLWRLAKWARIKSHVPSELPKMPTLVKSVQRGVGEELATSFEDKARFLADEFFPAPPPADLSDIPGAAYPVSVHCPAVVTKEEVVEAMKRLSPDKAPGPDGITNRFLKACGDGLISVLTSFFQTCVSRGYHSKTYQKNNTVILRKPGKSNYGVAKAWRPIALLSTVGKILESIISKKLSYLAEHHGWLPAAQMGARPNRSTETALELLTEQVHTVWRTGANKVATLLSMNVARTFPTVNHVKLIHNLRKKKMSN